MTVLRTFSDGDQVVFESGAFDAFRVSIRSETGQHKKTPTDEDFFAYFLGCGEGAETFARLRAFADRIRPDTDLATLELPILKGGLSEEKLLTAYAACLIAEERKAGTRLGKRVKLLGLFHALVERLPPRRAAAWSKGKPWREIAQACATAGF